MTHKTIEFEPSRNSSVMETEPWKPEKTGSYQDNLLKPEYAARKLKFPVGITWLRVVPAIKNSKSRWMMGVYALNYNGGRYAHPRDRSARRSVFDKAYTWCKQFRPELLFNKDNKNGAKLLPDKVCVFWALTEENGRIVSRLIVGSAYDGSRGGSQGLCYSIWQLANERDENDNLIANFDDPNEGVMICVEKVQPAGAKYPSYRFRRGTQAHPISDMIEKMDNSEFEALCPLEDVIQEPSSTEEWGYLENVLPAEIVKEIRANVD